MDEVNRLINTSFVHLAWNGWTGFLPTWWPQSWPSGLALIIKRDASVSKVPEGLAGNLTIRQLLDFHNRRSRMQNRIAGMRWPPSSVGKDKKIGTHFLRVTLVFISREGDGWGEMWVNQLKATCPHHLWRISFHTSYLFKELIGLFLHNLEKYSDSLLTYRNISNRIIQKIYLNS